MRGMEKTKKREIWERRKLLTGAATIAAGGLAAKLIGALYRIPLTNLIGSEGIGLYQLVYPFYCLLLTVSATGSPSAIATLTAPVKPPFIFQHNMPQTTSKPPKQITA